MTGITAELSTRISTIYLSHGHLCMNEARVIPSLLFRTETCTPTGKNIAADLEFWPYFPGRWKGR
jgi:hypothetical protein